jgi:hypothetical protein
MSKETRYRNVIHHRQYPLDVLQKLFAYYKREMVQYSIKHLAYKF